MKRLLLLSTLLLLGVNLASAQNPHFIKASGDIDNDGDLIVSFKIAGLGSEVTTVTVTGTLTAQWGCFNRGGKNPEAENKQEFSASFSVSEDFTPRNGQVTGAVVTSPDEPDFCPPGQDTLLISVTYSGVSAVASNTLGTTSISLGTFSDTLIPGV